MNDLVVIPARAGSVGVKGKNKRLLHGKPLIEYTVEYARQHFNDNQICVSTDDHEIIDMLEKAGLSIPFVRPAKLADSIATSENVLKHAVEFYQSERRMLVNRVIMMQPTSPFRHYNHIKEMLDLYYDGIDMVVSGCLSQSNPYYTLFEYTDAGYLKKSKNGNFTRRQDCPPIFEYNGAIYLINVKSLFSKGFGDFDKIVPYNMESIYSADIDTEIDFQWCEFLLEKGLIH